MATTIRINNNDLLKFNSFIGEMQMRSGTTITQAQAFQSLLNQYQHYAEYHKMTRLLLDYTYPKQGGTTYDSGFNAGWEAALFMAMGCVEDAVNEIGDDFSEWLESVDSKELKQWIAERLGEFEESKGEGD